MCTFPVNAEWFYFMTMLQSYHRHIKDPENWYLYKKPTRWWRSVLLSLHVAVTMLLACFLTWQSPSIQWHCHLWRRAHPAQWRGHGGRARGHRPLYPGWTGPAGMACLHKEWARANVTMFTVITEKFSWDVFFSFTGDPSHIAAKTLTCSKNLFWFVLRGRKCILFARPQGYMFWWVRLNVNITFVHLHENSTGHL